MLLNVTRCRSLAEFKAIATSPTSLVSEMAAFEADLITSDKITYVGYDRFTVPGHCLVCSQDVAFLVGFEHCSLGGDGQRTPNWREHMRCPQCELNNRMRAAAWFLLAVSQPSDAIYLTEAVTPLFKALSSHRRRLCGSEYLRDGTGRGKRNAQGIQHQDVTQLTFPDEAFNVIGSFEVLEHVPAYTRALCELSRCLRPGGTLLLTVPFILSSATTLTRATIDDAGQVTHLLPPEIHGDPLDDTGALCFYHFGWDLLDQLAEVGLEDTSISMFWEPRYGYLGGYQFIITARKQASPKRWASLFRTLQRAFGASAKRHHCQTLDEGERVCGDGASDVADAIGEVGS